MKPEIFAIDFDGTLCEYAWPGIGKPHNDIIDWAKRLRKDGHKLILWTCRCGMPLIDAVVWCADHGLFFDAINDNLEENKRRYGGDTRKVLADYYVDDRAVYPSAKPIYFK